MKARFSPSPTGLMHLGNLRTALFNYLLAKPLGKDPGSFLLRIEDTDNQRSTQGFIDKLIEDLHWMGISWQEGPEVGGPAGPYRQSQRNDIYEKYYQQLLVEGKAYWCFCTDQELTLVRRQQMSAGHPPRYAGTCRHLTEEQKQKKLAQGLKPALRFQIPDNEAVTFDDFIQGSRIFQTNDIGDFIIKKNDDSASFMFCNAIDDALMNITHVMRGDDHLTNTPRQLLILKAVGLKAPLYGHMSLILGEDGKPLSKRNGSLSVDELKELGYFPLSIANYLARLGHHFPVETFLNKTELSEAFSIAHLSKSPSRFDTHQLSHWQKECLKTLNAQQLWDWMSDSVKGIVPEDKAISFVETVRDNVVVLKDAVDWANWLFKPLENPKGHECLKEAGANYFVEAVKAVEKHGAEVQPVLDHLKQTLDVKGKKLFMPMRVALTGVDHGPELPKIFALLGKDRIIEKLKLTY